MEFQEQKTDESARRELPAEIILHIMSYLPRSSLFKFRSVCKLWNTLFMHPHLSILFLKHSICSDLNLYDVNYFEEAEYDDSKGEYFEKIAKSSQGLIVAQNIFPPLKYHIQCPRLRQRLGFPNPQNPSLCMALEFIPSNQAVKLVSVHENHQSLGYEILTLGIGSGQSTYCWRTVKVPQPNLLNSERDVNKRIQVFFRMGVAYCIWYVETEDDDLGIEVDVLDMVNETYIGHTTFPKGGFFSKLSHTNLLDWNGRLSFAQLVKDELHVLVLYDYKKLKWAERKRTVKLPFLKPDHKERITFTTFADNSMLFFVWNDKKSFFSYDINTGELITTAEFSRCINSIEEVAYLAALWVGARVLF